MLLYVIFQVGAGERVIVSGDENTPEIEPRPTCYLLLQSGVLTQSVAIFQVGAGDGWLVAFSVVICSKKGAC